MRVGFNLYFTFNKQRDKSTYPSYDTVLIMLKLRIRMCLLQTSSVTSENMNQSLRVKMKREGGAVAAF